MGKWDATRAARFASKTQRGAPGGCWLWLGTKTAAGYGQLRVRGVRVYAHRYAYEAAHGPIPSGLVVMHSCDNPSCVNPAHLSAGTYSQNTRDAVDRGLMAGWLGRRTHCKNGHAFTPENTQVNAKGWRRCRACGREAFYRAKARKAATSEPNKAQK